MSILRVMIAVSVLAVGGLCHVHAQQRADLSVEEFQAGDFGVPIGRTLSRSSKVSEDLLEICERISAEEDRLLEDLSAQEASQDNSDDMLGNHDQMFLELETRSVGQLLRFAREHQDTDSALTATLFAAILCHGEQKPAHEAAVRMLDEIVKLHPQRWQASVAPFVKSRLLYDGDRSCSESDRLKAAKTAVQHLTTDRSLTIPMNHPEVQMFLALYDISRFENPIRVNALMILANCEYALVFGEGFRQEQRGDFSVGQRLYQQVIDEYPESRSAQFARQMLSTIDAMEVSIERRSPENTP